MEDIYGPEDIEQLMLEKRFEELLETEKKYVLQHIEDESEYDAMRSMLLDLKQPGPELNPPDALKAELLALHEKKHQRPGFTVWLNSLFAAATIPIEWRSPALQMAGVLVLILGSVIVIQLFSGEIQSDKMALEVPDRTKEETPRAMEDLSISDNSADQVEDKHSSTVESMEPDMVSQNQVPIESTDLIPKDPDSASPISDGEQNYKEVQDDDVAYEYLGEAQETEDKEEEPSMNREATDAQRVDPWDLEMQSESKTEEVAITSVPATTRQSSSDQFSARSTESEVENDLNEVTYQKGHAIPAELLAELFTVQ